MKKSKIINSYERDMLESFENGEWVLSDNSAELKTIFKNAAKNTIVRDQRMNVKMTRQDMLSLKAKALEEGMSYQNLVSSVIHKYVSGKLVDKS